MNGWLPVSLWDIWIVKEHICWRKHIIGEFSGYNEDILIFVYCYLTYMSLSEEKEFYPYCLHTASPCIIMPIVWDPAGSLPTSLFHSPVTPPGIDGPGWGISWGHSASCFLTQNVYYNHTCGYLTVPSPGPKPCSTFGFFPHGWTVKPQKILYLVMADGWAISHGWFGGRCLLPCP